MYVCETCMVSGDLYHNRNFNKFRSCRFAKCLVCSKPFLCLDPCWYSSSSFFLLYPLFESPEVFPPSLVCIDVSTLFFPWPQSDPCFANREVHLADVPCHLWVSWIWIDVAHSFSPTLEHGNFPANHWPTGLWSKSYMAAAIANRQTDRWGVMDHNMYRKP